MNISQQLNQLRLGAEVSPVGAVSVDFTDIPVWFKRGRLLLNGLSTNGVGRYVVRLGVAGVFAVSGYKSSSSILHGTSSNASMYEDTGFVIYTDGAAFEVSGIFSIEKMGTNLYAVSGVGSDEVSANGNWVSGGRILLSGALDSIRLTNVSGVDTFDKGTVNFAYE